MLTFLATMEMQIKTMLILHLTPVRLANLQENKQMLMRMGWEKEKGKQPPHTLLVGMYTSTTTIKISMEVPQNTKNKTTLLPCHTTLLGIYPKECKINISRASWEPAAHTCNPSYLRG
jgi:hypothetical protein